jgi:hypothetical protein
VKKYHLFTGQPYDPGGGGMDEYTGSYESLEAAQEAGRDAVRDTFDYWFHVAVTTDDGLVKVLEGSSKLPQEESREEGK